MRKIQALLILVKKQYERDIMHPHMRAGLCSSINWIHMQDQISWGEQDLLLKYITRYMRSRKVWYDSEEKMTSTKDRLRDDAENWYAWRRSDTKSRLKWLDYNIERNKPHKNQKR